MIKKEVKKFILNNFGENRIICLLSYGSRSEHDEFQKFGDLDYLLVCDKFREQDYVLIKQLICKYPQLDFYMHYFDKLKKKGFENFQHGNHGVFFLNVFAEAKTIIGKNVFKKFYKKIGKNDEIKSLLFQIEEYFWRINHWYFTKNWDNELNRKFKKYFFRICFDILLCEQEFSYSKISQTSYDNFIKNHIMSSGSFSDKTKGMLIMLNKQKKDWNEKTFCLLTDSLHNDYIKIYDRFKSAR